MNKFKSFVKYGVLLAVLVGAGIGAYYFWSPRSGVYSFNDDRNSEFLHDLFKENWYWLVVDKKHIYDEEYVNYFIENKTVRSAPHQYGKNQMKVYFVDGKPAGFTSFFTRTSYIGKLLFLVVLEEYRGKGIGKKLLNSATETLFEQGCFKVELIVRTENKAAIRLYEGAGFEKYAEDEEAISYRKFKNKN